MWDEVHSAPRSVAEKESAQAMQTGRLVRTETHDRTKPVVDASCPDCGARRDALLLDAQAGPHKRAARARHGDAMAGGRPPRVGIGARDVAHQQEERRECVFTVRMHALSFR